MGWKKQSDFWLRHDDGHTISKGMVGDIPIYLLWTEDKKILGRFQSAEEAIKEHKKYER